MVEHILEEYQFLLQINVWGSIKRKSGYQYKCHIGLWQDLTEEYVITGGGREVVTVSKKLQALLTLFKSMENKKDIFASPCFTVLCVMERRRKETASDIPQVQAKHFCFQCKLLSPEDCAFSRSGSFCDWKNAIQRMMAHESSSAHSDATMTLCRRAKASGLVNSLLIDQCQAEHIYAKALWLLQ